ncbi:TIR domain-containing protein [Minwuia sp.]|uniref:TIR domain-containing protein n=1 Tax=Minwuia sp. TaxID=2493630 RepID=UPI003A95A718
MTEALIPDDQLPDDTAKVFLSYSRKDRERAQSIADVLRERHFGVFKDTDDILPTEEWRGRLEQLIQEADTIVFLLSPHSVASEVCAWEVEYATSLNKRVAPIVIEEVESGEIPPLLARLNFIFCTERDRFQDAVDNLVSALNTDIDWVREHTRLAGLAQRWSAAGRPARLLLRGQDISDAERWRDTRPADAPDVTGLQAAYLGESRRAATRRQRLTVTFSLVGLVAAMALAGFAYLQRETALENERRAVENEQQALTARAQAETARQQAIEQRDSAQKNQSLLLTQLAEAQIETDRPVEAALLALEALPDSRSIEPLRRDRPLVDEPLLALAEADRALKEIDILLTGSAHMRGALSPDERYLAVHSSESGEVKLYDLREMRLIRTVTSTARNRAPLAPAFRADSQMVLATGERGELLVVPVDETLEVRRLVVSENGLTGMGFVGDDSTVAVTDRERGASVFTLPDAKLLTRSSAKTMAVTRDGSRFALAEDGFVMLYDGRTRRVIGNSGREFKGPLKHPDTLKFSPDGKWLAAASEHKTWIMNGETAAFYGATPNRDISQLRIGFSPDSRWYFITGADGRTLIYDLDGKTTAASHAGPEGWVFDAAIAPDRNTVVTAGSTGELQVWNPQTNEVRARLLGHETVVQQVWLIENGTKALSLSEDGTVRLWALPAAMRPDGDSLIDGYQGEPVYSRDSRLLALSEAGIFGVRDGHLHYRAGDGPIHVYEKFSDDAGLVLARMQDRRTGDRPDVCLIDTADGSVTRCMLNRAEGNIWSVDMDGAVTTVAAHVVTDKKSSIQTFDARSGARIGHRPFQPWSPTEGELGDLSEPRVSPDGQRIIVQQNRSTLTMFDRSLSEVLWTHETPLADARIAVSPDADFALFYSPEEQKAVYWDLERRAKAAEYALPLSKLTQPNFSASGRFLVTRGDDGNLNVIEARTGRVSLQPRYPGRAGLRQPRFAANDTLFLASADAVTVVWDVGTGRKLADFTMDFGDYAPTVFAKAVFDDGQTLVTWGWQGPQEWRLNTDADAYVAAMQDRMPRCLSLKQRRTFFLPPEPPRWCITGAGRERESSPAEWRPKWPFHTTEWAEWLVARDRGEEVTPPE